MLRMALSGTLRGVSSLTAAVAANPSPSSALIYRLPVEPLAHAIELGGGMANLGLRRNPDGESDPMLERLYRAWTRARTQGWVSIWMADELCVHLLGVHPSFLYGDGWWETLATVDEARELRHPYVEEPVALLA